MRIFFTIVLPIIMLSLGLAYAFNVQRKYYTKWYKEVSFRKIMIHILPIFIKSVILYTLIIIIHNTAHNDSYLELTLFILVLFMFSIIQSSYSISAFLSRGESLLATIASFYKDSTNRADRFFNKLLDLSASAGSRIIKILIIAGFIIIFIPNISLFITTNVLYAFLILLLVVLSLVLNNVLYFGLISLMIIQFEPGSMTFSDINYPVMISSFIVIFIGIALESRLERKMFFIINVLEVKKLNFNLGYHTIQNNRNYILYQNYVNHYYYIYFRQVGLVVVFYCDFKVELSTHVINSMVKRGRYVLRNSDIIV